jgi:hypothetical protein
MDGGSGAGPGTGLMNSEATTTMLGFCSASSLVALGRALFVFAVVAGLAAVGVLVVQK